MTIFAANLVALGVVLLAFSGMFFSTPGQLVNFPGMHFETTESRVIAPVVGALMVIAGVVLLLLEPKRAT